MNKVTMFSTYEKMSEYVADIIEDIFKKSLLYPKLRPNPLDSQVKNPKCTYEIDIPYL